MSSLNQSSFSWAIRLLPASQRHPMVALYGFCRLIDDIADGSSADRIEQLQLCRNDLENILNTPPKNFPQIAPLASLIKDYAVPHESLIAILDGVEMDVKDNFHAPSWEKLEVYCQKVAGAVGIAILAILNRPDAYSLAIPLGNALQLTNILRDYRGDAQLGRLYIPSPALIEAGINPQSSIEEILKDPRFSLSLEIVTQRAKDFFQITENLLTQMPTKRLYPVLIMMRTYRLTLEQMSCNGFQPIPLSPLHRLWIALSIRIKGFFIL